MYVLLMVTGVVVGVIGAVMIAFGVPINEFSLGNTLIVSGTTSLSAGLILIGLAVVVRQLGRIADALDGQVPRAARLAELPEAASAPRPAPPRVPFPPKPASRDGREAPTPEPRVGEVGPEARLGEPPVESRRPLDLRPGEPRPDTAEAGGRLRPIIPPVANNHGAAAEVEESVPLSPQVSPDAPARGGAIFPRPASDRAPAIPSARTAPDVPARAVGSAAAEVLRGPRLDAPWRPTSPAERDRQGEAAAPSERPARGLFDSLWPPESGRKPGEAIRSEPRMPGAPAPRDEQDTPPDAPPDVPQPDMSSAERDEAPAEREALEEGAAPVGNGAPAAEQPVPEAEPSAAPAPVEERRAVSILKSGVVDGMAYTLYSDGSIEAELPEGTIRFTSIDDLRRHLDQHS